MRNGLGPKEKIMRFRSNLIWIATIVATTSVLAAVILTQRVVGDAVLQLKTGETAVTSIFIENYGGPKVGGQIYFQKEASKDFEAFEFRALTVDTFKAAPGFAYMEGIGVLAFDKSSRAKTNYSMTILDNESTPKSPADFVDFATFDAKGNAMHWYGWVTKGDISVTEAEK